MKLNYTQPYQWKWVCVQHPMVLLSRDMSEPRALETVPPWGGESIHGYSVKLYEMLQKAKETPELKIDFDLSAKELLLFLECVPEGRELMRELIAQKRLGFVGCDYAQAHYHTARSESALRQLRMGARVFAEVLDYKTDTFQHQETGLFENLPQLLRAFGITKSAIHTFSSAFEFLEVPALEICSNFGRLELVRNETIARWQGLDGSCIPIYLPIVNNHLSIGDEVETVFETVSRPEFKELFGKAPDIFHTYPTEYEENRGLYRNGSIIVQCPDLISIDDAYVADRRRVGDFWLLSEAIEEEMKTATRMPRIRYYTYWSYAEGQFGEMMFQSYRDCEQTLLAAEAMRVLAARSGQEAPRFDADAAWDRLLTAQHHDVNWMDTRELKEWALDQVRQAKQSAQAYLGQAAQAITGGKVGCGEYVTAFNTLPVARKARASVEVDPGKRYAVLDGGEELPAQQDGGTLEFEADFAGLGYRSFRLAERPVAVTEEETLDGPYHFENEVMTVTVLPDGRIASLCSKSSGERLREPGNLIRGKLIRPGGSEVWISNKDASSSMTLRRGPLYDRLTVRGEIEDIPYRMVIDLPHGSGGTLEFQLDLEFNWHEIGDFYHDETKLGLHWPLAQQQPEIYLDEPFGVIRGRPDRPLHAANFLALLEKGKGVAFGHGGTPKSWVSGGTLVNLLAWGSKNFTNRSPWGWSTMDIFDMRLRGNSHYQYSMGIAESGDIPALCAGANSRITPVAALRCEKDPGECTLLSLQNGNLIPTAVEEQDGLAVVRAYDVSGRESACAVTTDWELAVRTDVAGKECEGEAVRPYEVFELRYR